MAALSQLQRLVVPQTGRHTASIIFLHGSGDTGQGIRAWVKDVLSKDLIFPHIRVIYPTAPLRPYTPMNGALSTVWFDRTKIVNNCPEHLTSIDLMCQLLDGLVGEEVKAGIPKERIIIGGFSMGGCMAMHLAYRFHQQVAGVFALSSFLNNNSVVYQAVQNAKTSMPELFQCHGKTDPLVLYEWGTETCSNLQSLGVKTTFNSFPNLYHELCKPELEQLKSWILQKLPNDKQ
ncbi:lysophospholipase-like protein 1 isoform X3 [Callorhinchus milii]|uniref:Lysophospholipase-like protein 1 n=1 Tax=Callorhinchus milii TaxID=7868 RepID=A0A4W3JJV7_CALMI|nr:lysophospholipase-like protein 1 isoform X3 [Callorhinchus milii]|eukprot:gi/632972541/ref/XP_007902709.1/ PREDICTED: lysophospholipase-like protein 1 isoform X3 [Callorhinchus milii]